MRVKSILTRLSRRNSLVRFATFCELNRTIIEEITGNQLRRDLDTRAVMQLNQFLAIAGLKLIPSSRKTRDGVQTHEYKLDPHRLALMSRLSANYHPIEFSNPSSNRSWAA